MPTNAPQHEPARPEDDTTTRSNAIRLFGKAVIAGIRSPAVWIPALVLAGLTIVFRITDADSRISHWFYSGSGSGNATDVRFPLMTAWPWKTLYDWGCYPALIVGACGWVVWVVGAVWKRLKPWQDAGLFLGLLLLIGPGLIINCVLKPYWDRPRPYNIISFGGQQPFVPVLERGPGQNNLSFPSGHAAMGFYLMAPAFIFYRSRPRLAWAFLTFGLMSGCIIGMARIVAGGHFTSDVLWSFGVVYFTALTLALPFRFR